MSYQYNNYESYQSYEPSRSSYSNYQTSQNKSSPPIWLLILVIVLVYLLLIKLCRRILQEDGEEERERQEQDYFQARPRQTNNVIFHDEYSSMIGSTHTTVQLQELPEITPSVPNINNNTRIYQEAGNKRSSLRLDSSQEHNQIPAQVTIYEIIVRTPQQRPRQNASVVFVDEYASMTESNHSALSSSRAPIPSAPTRVLDRNDSIPQYEGPPNYDEAMQFLTAKENQKKQEPPIT